MTGKWDSMPTDQPTSFHRVAADTKNIGFVREVMHFLREKKKWWLLPVLLILLPFGLLMILSGTAAAPFIYTLF
jgi:Family of unknown function (DUF5989)